MPLMDPKPVKEPKAERRPLKRGKPMKRGYIKTKPRPSVSVKAARHLVKIKALPCVVCGKLGPSDAHHVFHDRFSQKRASDFATIPLCKQHHQNGPDAIHTDKALWRERFGPDYMFIPVVLESLKIMEA